MYNPTKQYRCDIIRGKTQKADDLIPTYVDIIEQLSPMPKEEFDKQFQNELFKRFPSMENGQNPQKTANNHRSEMAGKLLGLFMVKDGIVYETERARRFRESGDIPAMFKDICYKFQFPNGMQKKQTIQERIQDGISLRPFSFVIKVLQEAEKKNMTLTQAEVFYYVLNSLHVLQGKATPEEVIEAIRSDRQHGIANSVPSGSRATQHLREEINLLVKANLLKIEGSRKELILNRGEKETLDFFAESWDRKPEVPFNLDSIDRNIAEWNRYYLETPPASPGFETTPEKILPPDELEKIAPLISSEDHGSETTVEIGDKGEQLVFKLEKERVRSFNPNYVRKVLHLGKIKGLGYDIQTVVAEKGPLREFKKFIEVKTTSRTSVPNFNDPEWRDSVNITRNEWVAAKQYREFYSIFRVYLTSRGVFIHELKNPAKKVKDEIIDLTPLQYRMDFDKKAIDDRREITANEQEQ